MFLAPKRKKKWGKKTDLEQNHGTIKSLFELAPRKLGTTEESLKNT